MMRLSNTPRGIALALGWGLLALAAFSTLLCAAATAPGATSPKTSRLLVNSSRWSRKTEGLTTIDTLPQATIVHEDTRFTADLMVMKSEGDTHEITCTGNPVLTDPENHITGEKVIALSTPRQAEFLGNVKMVSTPKQKNVPKAMNSGDLRDKFGSDPSTTTCDHLLYYYSTKRAHAYGHVVIVQKARTVWANEATYDQSLELVTLAGNVHMKNTGEEELKDLSNAETVTISLQTDWVDIAAKQGEQLRMEFIVKDDEPTPAGGAHPSGEHKSHPAEPTPPPAPPQPPDEPAPPQAPEGAGK